jgi:hypothetical protein
MKTYEPPSDLLDDLRNDPDPELGDPENVGGAPNRFQRLLVADWVLNGPSSKLDLRSVLDLYEGCGRPYLLDEPGRLTVASIYAEVLSLLETKEACGGTPKET